MESVVFALKDNPGVNSIAKPLSSAVNDRFQAERQHNAGPDAAPTLLCDDDTSSRYEVLKQRTMQDGQTFTGKEGNLYGKLTTWSLNLSVAFVAKVATRAQKMDVYGWVVNDDTLMDAELEKVTDAIVAYKCQFAKGLVVSVKHHFPHIELPDAALSEYVERIGFCEVVNHIVKEDTCFSQPVYDAVLNAPAITGNPIENEELRKRVAREVMNSVETTMKQRRLSPASWEEAVGEPEAGDGHARGEGDGEGAQEATMEGGKPFGPGDVDIAGSVQQAVYDCENEGTLALYREAREKDVSSKAKALKLKTNNFRGALKRGCDAALKVATADIRNQGLVPQFNEYLGMDQWARKTDPTDLMGAIASSMALVVFNLMTATVSQCLNHFGNKSHPKVRAFIEAVQVTDAVRQLMDPFVQRYLVCEALQLDKSKDQREGEAKLDELDEVFNETMHLAEESYNWWLGSLEGDGYAACFDSDSSPDDAAMDSKDPSDWPRRDILGQYWDFYPKHWICEPELVGINMNQLNDVVRLINDVFNHPIMEAIQKGDHQGLCQVTAGSMYHDDWELGSLSFAGNKDGRYLADLCVNHELFSDVHKQTMLLASAGFLADWKT